MHIIRTIILYYSTIKLLIILLILSFGGEVKELLCLLCALYVLYALRKYPYFFDRL